MSFKSYSTRSVDLADPAALLVKPDVGRLRLAFQVEGLGHERERAALRESLEAVARLVHGRLPAATVLPAEISATAPHEGKSFGDGPTRLSAVLELGLEQTADFWARTELEGSLLTLADLLVQEVKRGKSRVTLHTSAPQYLLREPEAFREELTRIWIARAQTLATALGPAWGLAEVQVPGPVVQHVRNVVEVALTLELQGHLGPAPRRP